MKSINVWLEQYGESHQNSINKKIHWICVPLIMLSLMGLLWSIPLPIEFFLIYKEKSYFVPINLATLFISICTIYYFVLSINIAIGMIGVSILLILGVMALKSIQYFELWEISLLIFIFAWIGQFIGHKIEGKKPSFLEDIQFLLIGPAWLMSFVYDKFKIKY